MLFLWGFFPQRRHLMAKKSMTIKDVKDKKTKLELDILKMVQDFEKECEVYASYISLDRKRDKETYPEEVSPAKKGPVINVDISMDLDLIY